MAMVEGVEKEYNLKNPVQIKIQGGAQIAHFDLHIKPFSQPLLFYLFAQDPSRHFHGPISITFLPRFLVVVVLMTVIMLFPI